MLDFFTDASVKALTRLVNAIEAVQGMKFIREFVLLSSCIQTCILKLMPSIIAHFCISLAPFLPH